MKRNKQSGFTLVEIAIVLVIIGLLLGGVLKGQAMISSAKVKALGAEMKAIPTMIFAYQDKFRAVPGDDRAVATHLLPPLTPTQATGNQTGNGAINTGNWTGLAAPTAPAANNESSLFWQHVRMAGLSTGSELSGTAANALGGVLGVTSGTLRPVLAGVSGSFFVCSGTIPGDIAVQLDTALDDGVGTSGSTFGGTNATGQVIANNAATAAYVAANKYTVCSAN